MDFTFTRAMMKLKMVNPIKFKPIGVRNQKKFAPNPDCAPVSIWSITFGSDVQLR